MNLLGLNTRVEMAGQRVYKLTVLEFSHIGENNNQAYWKCRCDCGNTSVVSGAVLRAGKAKSCGCYRAECASTTHKTKHKTINGVECKKCSYCKDWVELSGFSMETDHTDGLSSSCKSCFVLIRKKKPKNKEYFREWANRKYQTDINYKIKGCIQSRIRQALKNKWKAGRTAELLGCSIEELKTWLEQQFDRNMTWENYGTFWHIDHRKPCSWFNLSDPKQQKLCFHYTNLQPLSAVENLSKRDRYAHSPYNA